MNGKKIDEIKLSAKKNIKQMMWCKMVQFSNDDDTQYFDNKKKEYIEFNAHTHTY